MVISVLHHAYHIGSLLVLFTSALSLSRGVSSPRNSEQMPHSSPVRVMYGVSFWIDILTKVLKSFLSFMFNIMSYSTLQWPRLRLKSPAWRLFTQPFIQAQIKGNIKAPRHWLLCGEFTGTGEFPAQRASYAENVSIWWRHHGPRYIESLWYNADACIVRTWMDMQWAFFWHCVSLWHCI